MRLGTIYLEVGDVEVVAKLKGFYRDVLNLAVRSEHGSESVWFDAGSVSLGFHVGDALRDPGLVNLSFDIDDLDGEVDRLEGAGVRFAQRPMEAPWGGRIATFFDPAGHTVWLAGA